MDPISLGLAALNFGTQAFGAISGYNEQQAEAARQNAYNKKIYNLQIRNQRMQYASRVADFGNRKIQYQQQQGYNFDAAQRAYQSEQDRLNELQKQMRFSYQGSQIAENEALGRVQAREVSGRSMDRMRTMVGGAAGRNEAIMSEQFNTARRVAGQRNERTRQQLMIANDRAFWNVGQPPLPTELPPPPLAVQGPSQGSLIAGLGQAAIGAYGTYQKFA